MKKVLIAIILLFSLTLVSCDKSSEQEEPKIFEVGQTITYGDYKIGVSSVTNTNTIPAIGMGYTTQNNYMCILIYLYNGSNLMKMYSHTDFTVNLGTVKYKSKGTEAFYYARSVGTLYEDLYTTGYIDSNLGGYYYLVFETPSASTNDDYVLEYKYSSLNNKSMYFNL